MLPSTIKENNLFKFLKKNHVDFLLINNSIAIESSIHAVTSNLCSIEETAPTFVLKNNDQYIWHISGAVRLSFKKIKKFLEINNLSFATREEIIALFNVSPGYIPLINNGFSTIIDSTISELSFAMEEVV